MSTIDWHPEDPATLADPYPVFARMRDEDPCFWSPRLKSWVLTRYDDVKAVCLDKERLSSDRLRPFFASLPPPEAERIGQIIRYLSQWMVFKDPPDHTRLRRLTSRVFHAKSMQAMRPQVADIADWLMDGIGARTEFDFITDFAGPLPCLVIMALLGVPRGDLAEVKRMSDEMALFIGSSRTSPEKYDTAEAATREMAAFFQRLIDALHGRRQFRRRHRQAGRCQLCSVKSFRQLHQRGIPLCPHRFHDGPRPFIDHRVKQARTASCPDQLRFKIGVAVTRHVHRGHATPPGTRKSKRPPSRFWRRDSQLHPSTPPLPPHAPRPCAFAGG